jgi:PAS domain S-box-containing protein
VVTPGTVSTPAPNASRPSRAIPWHRRLEARVAVGVSLVVGTALLAVLLATGRIVQANALSRAADDLQAARVAFYHLVDTRAGFAAAQLRLIVELPVFRAHLSDPRLATDAATIHAMADGYRRSLEAHFAVVTDPAGNWIAGPGWPDRAGAPPELTAGITAARGGRTHRAIVVIDNRLYLVVTQAAKFADELLATVTAGYQLDDIVARELALTTRCDVSLIVGQRLSGSSLARQQREGLAQLLRDHPDAISSRTSSPELRAIGDVEYVSGTYPLQADDAGDSAGALVLLQDLKTTHQFIEEIRTRVLWLGALTFGLALASALVVSRQMTRSLREIASVTGEIAAGRWDRTVPVHGNGEAAVMAVAFNDMTASLSHWHAEAASKAQQLQDSYDRFFAVTQSASDAIVSTDESGAIIFWNRSAAATFGYEEDDALGRPFAGMIDEPFRDAYGAKVRQVDIGAHASSDATMEAVAIRKDGSTFAVELSLATWKSAERVNFTAIVRDISERKRVEAALRDRDAELRQAQKMEAIGRLAGGVAHDFNNLLTAIQGYGELLLNGVGDNHVQRANVTQILKAADSAGSLTRQLLAFSRKQLLASKVVSFEDIVRGTEKILRRLIGENIELTVRSAPGLWPVVADPGQLEQVVMNLALNARDAMPDGGSLLIELANVEVGDTGGMSPAPGQYVELTIVDSGLGMDSTTMARIFEPFFTTKGEGRGTGLGLAMVHGIVEQSGGSISVQSEPGRGTTFRVILPRAQNAAVAIEAGTPRRAAGRRSETVLLVEDEPSVRALASRVLREEGYAVLEASRGDEALELAARDPRVIHLLLSDVVMPGLSGRDLWERLSAARPDVKVLFMSGYTDDAVVRHGIREAGLPFLQKPFSLATLADAVRRALESETVAGR